MGSGVRYNALRHGVFSSKLVVPDQDKETFNHLQDELRKQLKPETALLQLAFQRVVTAAWRFRQAVEMEARRIQVQPDSGKQETEATGEVVNVPQWYAGGRQELNAAKRLLEVVREKVRTSGGLHLNELKDAICATFGARFYEALAALQPKNDTAGILLEETVSEHARRFTPGSPARGLGLPILEDRARWDMMVTLIDMKGQHIADLYRALDQPNANPEQQAGLDTVNRYITSAAREVRACCRWYFDLRQDAI